MLGVESGGLPVEFPPSCTYDRWAGLIGFTKLITCICISPRKRFSFLPWLLLGRGTREERSGRIIFTKKFVITLTISSSLLLPNIRRLLLIWIDLSLFLSLASLSFFFYSDCNEPLRYAVAFTSSRTTLSSLSCRVVDYGHSTANEICRPG